MKILKVLWRALASQFAGERGKRMLEVIVRNTPLAIPYIELAASITPTNVDDFALRWLKDRYPRFFDGTPLTDDEMKLLRFVFASERLMAEIDELDHTTSRAAISNAYAIRKSK